MADKYCNQCAQLLFGTEGDFAGLVTKPAQAGFARVHCASCGPTRVDAKGNCISDQCLRNHDTREFPNV